MAATAWWPLPEGSIATALSMGFYATWSIWVCHIVIEHVSVWHSSSEFKSAARAAQHSLA